MPHPFDATLKDLVRRYPDDFKRLLGLKTPGKAHALNVDLAIVSAATDVVLGIGEPPTVVVDLNFQASRDRQLASRLHLYNALLHNQLQVPVQSTVVLLRREADDPALTGKLRYHVALRRGRVYFEFEVVRLWRQPVKRFLTGPLGGLPLAVLAQMPGGASPQRALPKVLHDIEARVARNLPPPQIADLWAAAFVLSGLRLPRTQAVGIFKGVLAMKESTTYQYILEEGKKEGVLDGVRETLISVGEDRFGKPPAAVLKTLRSIDDRDRLRRMSKKLLHARSWQELLDTP